MTWLSTPRMPGIIWLTTGIIDLIVFGASLRTDTWHYLALALPLVAIELRIGMALLHGSFRRMQWQRLTWSAPITIPLPDAASARLRLTSIHAWMDSGLHLAYFGSVALASRNVVDLVLTLPALVLIGVFGIICIMMLFFMRTGI